MSVPGDASPKAPTVGKAIHGPLNENIHVFINPSQANQSPASNSKYE